MPTNDYTVEIKGIEYTIPKEVFELILAISKERDSYKSQLHLNSSQTYSPPPVKVEYDGRRHIVK